jgi:hypothetical protein
VYEDTVPGLAELAKYGIVVTLSNGNYRLLIDMVSRSLQRTDSGRRGDRRVGKEQATSVGRNLVDRVLWGVQAVRSIQRFGGLALG